MSKILFVGDSSKTYDGNISSIGQNQISVTFIGEMPEDEVVTSGFDVVNEHNGLPQGSYRSYTHIFRKDTGYANEIWLSNDMSEYIPPVLPADPGQSSGTTVVTASGLTIAEAIAIKKVDFGNVCKVAIETGVTVKINGVREHFAYSLSGGDQTNIDDIFNTMMTTGLGQFYHNDGGNCKMYTPWQVFRIYIAQKINKLKHTTYHNQLVRMVEDTYSDMENTFENRQTILRIQYGVPEETLTGEYLERYNSIMGEMNTMYETLHERVTAIVGEDDTPAEDLVDDEPEQLIPENE